MKVQTAALHADILYEANFPFELWIFTFLLHFNLVNVINLRKNTLPMDFQIIYTFHAIDLRCENIQQYCLI